MHEQPQAYIDSQDSPQLKLGGSHDLLFIILSMTSHGGYTQMSFFLGLIS
jgi:hypothetical protein